MSRAPLTLAFLCVLVGCPTPPTAYESTSSTPSSGQQAGASGQQAGASGQQGNNMLDFSQVTPQKTQEQLKSEEHVSVAGTIGGTCTGKIRIDVISNAPPAPGAAMGPLTSAEFTAVGAYSLLVPTGTSARLTALCDNDSDGKIVSGKDGMSKPATISEAKTDQTGIDLSIEDIPTQPAQGGGQGGGQGGQMGGQGGGQMGGQGGGQMMGGQGGGQGGGQMMGGQGGGQGGGQAGGQ